MKARALKTLAGWRGYALAMAGAALLAGALAAWVQGLRIDVLEAELRAERIQVTVLAAANEQAERDIAAARGAVAALRQEAAEREAAARAAQEQAERDIRQLEGRLGYWETRPPAAGADSCGAISDLRQEYMQGRWRR